MGTNDPTNGEYAGQGSTDQPSTPSWQTPNEPPASAPTSSEPTAYPSPDAAQPGVPQPDASPIQQIQTPPQVTTPGGDPANPLAQAVPPFAAPPTYPALQSQPVPPPGWPQYAQGAGSMPPAGYFPLPSQPLQPMAGWPPQPGMSAPLTQPGIGSTPVPLGYAGPPSGYYGQVPGAGWPPQPGPWTVPLPQETSRGRGKTLAVLLIGALLLVLVSGGIGFALRGLPVSTPSVAATNTMAPTATATPDVDFSAAVPGPGCGTLGWSIPGHQSSSLMKCGASSVTLQDPASNSVNTSIFWGNPYPDSTFTARATVSPLTDACGGVGFESDYRAYLGYVCANGNWYVFRYDDTGSPTMQSSGAVGTETQYTVSVTVATDTFALSINGAQVSSVTRASGYEATYIALEMYHYEGKDGTAAFSNFSFAHSS